MTEKVFIDTNIFIYAYTADDEPKNEASCDLLRENVGKENIVVSTQVLNEFYSVMAKYDYSHNQIKSYLIEIAEQVEVSPLSFRTIESCLLVKEKYGYSWWDSLVFTSALENDCEIIYSEDMQHGQVIENTLKIVNPFV
ncbi:MAG: PIN domain-containing protein [Fibromonadaceae bacterium]|jgi:predicted nucleic acid-binding protein|nr:PIN domain-containing protein [Fibromonadaceae bacterium]